MADDEVKSTRIKIAGNNVTLAEDHPWVGSALDESRTNSSRDDSEDLVGDTKGSKK